MKVMRFVNLEEEGYRWLGKKPCRINAPDIFLNFARGC
jgi:hypothetical protein